MAERWADESPEWDEELAEALVGCTVLVGLTHRAPGEEDRLEQMHGVVVEADPEEGVEIALSGRRSGETYWLPPDLSAFEPAERGSYRLQSTGESVDDPDFVTTWIVEAPPH
jgi:hypothetical protein